MNKTEKSARAVALLILEAVLDHGKDTAWMFDRSLEYASLSPEDKRFCFLLVMTALRWYGVHQQWIAGRVQKPLRKNLRKVELILHLGLTQLAVNVPHHALADTSVELAKQNGFDTQAGLVNALLRRAIREEFKPSEENPSHFIPGWLFARWQEFYGERVMKIATAHTQEAPLDLSLKNPQSAADWARKLHGKILPSGSIRLTEHARVDQLEGFGTGEWWVQDAAAALPALLLGDVKGLNVLDLCAAPGGKTAQLCAGGGVVTAVEKSPTRIKTLEENMQRLKFSPTILQADAGSYLPASPPDKILLDAPCTATGTLRRNPDIAWKRKEKDIAEQSAIQAKLLAHAFQILKPGGMLVYAVCSLEREEGEEQVTRFLQRHADAELVPVKNGEHGIAAEWITARGELRTLPCHFKAEGGMDGFYAARIVKL